MDKGIIVSIKWISVCYQISLSQIRYTILCGNRYMIIPLFDASKETIYLAVFDQR